MSLELSSVLIPFIIILNEELTLSREFYFFAYPSYQFKESYNSNFTLKDVLSTDKTYFCL